MIKLIDILNEAKVIPQELTTDFTNTKHPSVYIFVKNNKIKILQAIKNDRDEGDDAVNETNFTEESGITDIYDTTVSNENYWEYLDEKGEFPNGQEIGISGNGQEGRHKGINITNIDPELYYKLASGVSWNEMPYPYDKMGLYYSYISY